MFLAKGAYWLMVVAKLVFKKVFGLVFVVVKVNKLKCVWVKKWLDYFYNKPISQ